MNTGRVASGPGRTRTCPHCKATILESSTVCPGCHHHLRFEPGQRAQPTVTPLKVEGAFKHPETATEPWEYSVVVAVRNGRGEEIARHVVGVGALQPAEERSFTLAVEVFSVQDAKEARASGKEIPTPLKSAQIKQPPVMSSAPGRDPRPPAPPPAHASVVPRAAAPPPRPAPAVREVRPQTRHVRTDARPVRSTGAPDPTQTAKKPPPGDDPETLPKGSD